MWRIPDRKYQNIDEGVQTDSWNKSYKYIRDNDLRLFRRFCSSCFDGKHGHKEQDTECGAPIIRRFECPQEMASGANSKALFLEHASAMIRWAQSLPASKMCDLLSMPYILPNTIWCSLFVISEMQKTKLAETGKGEDLQFSINSHLRLCVFVETFPQLPPCLMLASSDTFSSTISASREYTPRTGRIIQAISQPPMG